ncbi:hypothetical protein J6590_067043 [Homalodisca vitripennis]|nr:hypothetical protein J6590_067043 [Homalodisca vitripennis]
MCTKGRELTSKNTANRVPTSARVRLVYTTTPAVVDNLLKLLENSITRWPTLNIHCESAPHFSAVISSEVINPHLLAQQNDAIPPTSPVTLNNSITELESSLIENNFLEDSKNEEHKLLMAAKIGTALLEENKILKGEKFKLETKLAIVEGKLEEMEINEGKHIGRNEILLQQFAESQEQLGKEKKLRQEAQAIFEDHDLKLGQLIDNHLKEIDQQEKTILMLQKKLESQEVTYKTHKDSYTQTDSSATETSKQSQSSPPIVIELTEIKTKLDQVELAIKSFTIKSRTESTLPPQVAQNRSRQHSLPLRRKTSTGTKNNVFSVSLQAAKHKKQTIPRQECTVLARESQGQLRASQTCQDREYQRETMTTVTFNRQPPCTTHKLEDGETLEEFFTKNIANCEKISETHKRTSQNIPAEVGQISTETLEIDSSSNNQQTTNEPTSPSTAFFPHSFLEQTQYKKQRYRTKIFLRTRSNL